MPPIWTVELRNGRETTQIRKKLFFIWFIDLAITGLNLWSHYTDDLQLLYGRNGHYSVRIIHNFWHTLHCLRIMLAAGMMTASLMFDADYWNACLTLYNCFSEFWMELLFGITLAVRVMTPEGENADLLKRYALTFAVDTVLLIIPACVLHFDSFADFRRALWGIPDRRQRRNRIVRRRYLIF